MGHAIIGFNHGLPCYVRNMALGPQSRQKPRPTASVFVYLSPSGHVFNIAWQAMIKTYNTTNCQIQANVQSKNHKNIYRPCSMKKMMAMPKMNVMFSITCTWRDKIHNVGYQFVVPHRVMLGCWQVFPWYCPFWTCLHLFLCSCAITRQHSIGQVGANKSHSTAAKTDGLPWYTKHKFIAWPPMNLFKRNS